MWKAFIFSLIASFFKKAPIVVQPDQIDPPAITPEEKANLDYSEPKYLWGTKEQIRHSIRVICDEKGMSVEQKNTMCATIYGESEFILTAKNKNLNKLGRVVSVDYGLCQWNDYWHAKEITPEESVHNPEKAVRLMADYWKRGQRDLWIAYKSGRYKQFMALVQKPM